MLPETMHDFDFDEVPCIRVEGVHQEVEIMEKVKFPTLADQRIPEQIIQGDGILVERLW